MADARRRNSGDTAGDVPSAPTAQGDRKEVAGSTGMVRAQKPKRRLCVSKEGEAGPDPSQGRKTDSLEILPAQVGACLTGVYLKSVDNRPDDHCWWCDPDNNCGTQQTRDHLFKHCLRWKDQQAQLWARVKEVTKRGKQKWRMGDLLADERCSPAVLDFLRSTYVGWAAPPVEDNWDSDEEEEERAVAAAGVVRGGGRARWVVALGLLALEFASCFSFVWRGDVWRFVAWVCGVSFPWVEYFWCESRISLGAINLRISLLGRWVAATEPSGRQTGYGLCSAPP